MKARKLIDDAAYAPEMLTVMFQAFDEAWQAIEPRFVGDAAREEARLKLAGMILLLARDNSRDAQQLQRAAVNLMVGDCR